MTKRPTVRATDYVPSDTTGNESASDTDATPTAAPAPTTPPPTETPVAVTRIEAFDTYERGLIAHVQGLQAPVADMKPAQPKPLRLKVNPYEGKEGDNLHFWIREGLQAPVADMKPAQPKPLRLKVNPYEGKEGDNLHFWIREVELAMDAALISTERLRVGAKRIVMELVQAKFMRARVQM
ncbi:Gag protein [Phytophthora palmivora]|uniref:Gag protein n=1 Tax=Phytophthora palmivora TaxID=4796 RepID=A0A2P4YPM6_9STRA|nr:Gag protein [Phytophthora palmivora]